MRYLPTAFELAGYAAIAVAFFLVDLRLGLAVLGLIAVLEGREAKK